MKIKRLFKDKILAKIIMTDPRCGRFIIPETYQKKTQEAVVYKVGEDIDNIKVDDRIIYDAHVSNEIVIDDVTYLILDLEDVLAVVS